MGVSLAGYDEVHLRRRNPSDLCAHRACNCRSDGRKVPCAIHGTQQCPSNVTVTLKVPLCSQTVVDIPERLAQQTRLNGVGQTADLPVTGNGPDPQQTTGIILPFPFSHPASSLRLPPLVPIIYHKIHTELIGILTWDRALWHVRANVTTTPREYAVKDRSMVYQPTQNREQACDHRASLRIAGTSSATRRLILSQSCGQGIKRNSCGYGGVVHTLPVFIRFRAEIAQRRVQPTAIVKKPAMCRTHPLALRRASGTPGYASDHFFALYRRDSPSARCHTNSPRRSCWLRSRDPATGPDGDYRCIGCLDPNDGSTLPVAVAPESPSAGQLGQLRGHALRHSPAHNPVTEQVQDGR